MGRNRTWLGVLSAVALAACSEIDQHPVPSWGPWDQINGKYHSELEQVQVASVAKSVLRVVSYNVYRGVDVDEDAAYFASDPDLSSADVIGLQETTRSLADGAQSDVAQLAAALHMGYVFVPTFEYKGDVHGIGLLSRYPMLDVQVMMLPVTSDLTTEEQAARAALCVTIMTVEGPVHIVNVHLDPPLNMPERILQLRPAVIRTAAPAVILGDFNTNDFVWAADTIPVLPLDAIADTSQADSLDGYMEDIGYDTPTSELGSTWGGFPEDQRLDAIFTKGLVSGAGDVERELHTSDHWPLWLDVRVQP
jgi:endonuclease/exonuclease/phosphatase family metal-dependent hydrolase